MSDHALYVLDRIWDEELPKEFKRYNAKEYTYPLAVACSGCRDKESPYCKTQCKVRQNGITI